MGAMVLVNCYSSTIIAYLTVPKMKPSINTLQDLTANQDIDFILWGETIIGQIILVRNLKVGEGLLTLLRVQIGLICTNI